MKEGGGKHAREHISHTGKRTRRWEKPVRLDIFLSNGGTLALRISGR
jgi:hypothetical protein